MVNKTKKIISYHSKSYQYFISFTTQYLRKTLRTMKMYGVADKELKVQLDNLQKMYPHVNVTQMYNSTGLMMGGQWIVEQLNTQYRIITVPIRFPAQ